MEGNYVSFHGLSLTHSAGLKALQKVQKYDLLGGSRAQKAVYSSLSEQCESCLRSEVEIIVSRGCRSCSGFKKASTLLLRRCRSRSY